MGILTGLEPHEFFEKFEEISRIPRGSHHEKAISDTIKKFAEERGMSVEQDQYWNLLIKKKGTPGYENASPILFHGHMDMVLAQDEGVDIDMLKEGPRLVIDGDIIRAEGTTLGADNGIGVAIILCILESTDMPHPPIEAIITVQEEVGKVGAITFDAKNATGRRLIDFNWHNPKSIFAGCAGDISAWFELPVAFEPASPELAFFTLNVSGMTGGHSEFDIHRERANAIVNLFRIVNRVALEKEIHLTDVTAGVNRYVIPGSMSTMVAVPKADESAVRGIVETVAAELRNEYKLTDPHLTVTLEKAEAAQKVISATDTALAAKCVSLIPCGVQSMSLEIPGLVESSNTIAMMETTDHSLRILSTIPSAVTSRRYNILQKLRNLASLVEASVETFADCPEWPYKPDSKLLKTAKEAYVRLFHEEPEVEVSHSSLELGLFNAKLPGIEMISLGPRAYDVHTTKERFEYKTVAPVWELTKEILKSLKD